MFEYVFCLLLWIKSVYVLVHSSCGIRDFTNILWSCSDCIILNFSRFSKTCINWSQAAWSYCSIYGLYKLHDIVLFQCEWWMRLLSLGLWEILEACSFTAQVDTSLWFLEIMIWKRISLHIKNKLTATSLNLTVFLTAHVLQGFTFLMRWSKVSRDHLDFRLNKKRLCSVCVACLGKIASFHFVSNWMTLKHYLHWTTWRSTASDWGYKHLKAISVVTKNANKTWVHYLSVILLSLINITQDGITWNALRKTSILL